MKTESCRETGFFCDKQAGKAGRKVLMSRKGFGICWLVVAIISVFALPANADRDPEECGWSRLYYDCDGQCRERTSARDDCSSFSSSRSENCIDSTRCSDSCPELCGHPPEACGTLRYYYDCSGDCREKYWCSPDCSRCQVRYSDWCPAWANCLSSCPDCHDGGGGDCHGDDELGDSEYCTRSCPCEEEEGDCDPGDRDCLPGLDCVENVGECFGMSSGDDVCLPYEIECRDDDDCDDDNPDTRDRCRNDCDEDSYCENDLICSHDCSTGETGCFDSDTRWICGESDDGDRCLERINSDCLAGQYCFGGTCLTCRHECTSGSAGCVDFNTRWACGERGDGDPCLERIGSDCPGVQFCNEGLCVDCLDECTSFGDRECVDSRNLRFCHDYDDDSCLEWETITCRSRCSDGHCVAACTNDCLIGETGCVDSNTYWICDETGDGDDCLERVSEACPETSSYTSWGCEGGISSLTEYTNEWTCDGGDCRSEENMHIVEREGCDESESIDIGSPVCSPDGFEIWQYVRIGEGYCDDSTGRCNSMSGTDHRVISDCRGRRSRTDDPICNEENTAVTQATFEQEGYCDDLLNLCSWRDVGFPRYDTIERCSVTELCVRFGWGGSCEPIIPAEGPCLITDAFWEVTSAYDGQEVDMVIRTNEWCEGQRVSFEVMEDDIFRDDSMPYEYRPYASGIITGGTLRETWEARYWEDGDWGDNPSEYYFNVRQYSDDEPIRSNNLLEVSPYRYPETFNTRELLEEFAPRYEGTCDDYGTVTMSNECLQTLIEGGDEPRDIPELSLTYTEIVVGEVVGLVILCFPCPASLAIGAVTIWTGAFTGIGIAALGATPFLCELCAGMSIPTSTSRQVASRVAVHHITRHIDEMIPELRRAGWGVNDIITSPTGALVRLRNRANHLWIVITPDESTPWRIVARPILNGFAALDDSWYIVRNIRAERLRVIGINSRNIEAREEIIDLLVRRNRIFELSEDIIDELSSSTVTFDEAVRPLEIHSSLGEVLGEYDWHRASSGYGSAAPLKLSLSIRGEETLRLIPAMTEYDRVNFITHHILPHELSHATIIRRIFQLGYQPVRRMEDGPAGAGIRWVWSTQDYHEMLAEGLASRKLSRARFLLKQEEVGRDLRYINADPFERSLFEYVDAGFNTERAHRILMARLYGHHDLADEWLGLIPLEARPEEVEAIVSTMERMIPRFADEFFSPEGPSDELLDFLICVGIIQGECLGSWPLTNGQDTLELNMPEIVTAEAGEVIEVRIRPNFFISEMECLVDDAELAAELERTSYGFNVTVGPRESGNFTLSCTAQDWLSNTVSDNTTLIWGVIDINLRPDDSDVFWIDLGEEIRRVEPGGTIAVGIDSNRRIIHAECFEPGGNDRLVIEMMQHEEQFSARVTTTGSGWEAVVFRCMAISEFGERAEDYIAIYNYSGCHCSSSGRNGIIPSTALLLVFLFFVSRLRRK